MKGQLALALFFLLLVPLVSHAETYPQPIGFVNDFAGVLNETQRVQLGTFLAELERNTTAEIAVVTVESADDPFSYSVGLFQTWGIGKTANDNGILVFYAKAQNRIEVRTGYGVEGILPDSKVGRILDDYYVPMRDAGNVSAGIVAATEQLAQVVYANADEVRAGNTGASASIFSFITVIVGGFAPFFIPIIFFAIIVVIFSTSRAPKCPVDKIRMDVVKTERISAGFGRYNEIVYYKCKICGRTAQRKRSGGGFFVMVGGHGGGGFGGGGFGGGGTGGGGAGR